MSLDPHLAFRSSLVACWLSAMQGGNPRTNVAHPDMAATLRQRGRRRTGAGTPILSGRPCGRDAWRALPAAGGPAQPGDARVVARAALLTPVGSDLLRDVFRVPAGPEDQHRAERVLEREPGEVQARSRRYDASILLRPPIFAADRHLDPAEVLPEACAPNHVRRVDDTTVVEQRHAVPHPNRPGGHARDAGGSQIVTLEAQQRAAV